MSLCDMRVQYARLGFENTLLVVQGKRKLADLTEGKAKLTRFHEMWHRDRLAFRPRRPKFTAPRAACLSRKTLCRENKSKNKKATGQAAKQKKTGHASASQRLPLKGSITATKPQIQFFCYCYRFCLESGKQLGLPHTATSQGPRSWKLGVFCVFNRIEADIFFNGQPVARSMPTTKTHTCDAQSRRAWNTPSSTTLVPPGRPLFSAATLSIIAARAVSPASSQSLLLLLPPVAANAAPSIPDDDETDRSLDQPTRSSTEVSPKEAFFLPGEGVPIGPTAALHF